MKHITAITDSACRLVVTLNHHPLSAAVVVLLAVCAVAAGWAWRR